MELFRGNKLWEGSRFMMPEHVEGLREERKKREYHPQELDEQYLEQLSYQLQEALECENPVIVTYSSKYGLKQYCGFIAKITTEFIRLEDGSHSKTIDVGKIRDVEYPSDLEE